MALRRVDIRTWKPVKGSGVNRAASGHDYRTIKQRAALATKFKAGDFKSGERLIASYIGQVFAAATNKSGRGVPIDDLVQEGCLGVLQAVIVTNPKNEMDHFWGVSHYIFKQMDDAVPNYTRDHGPFDKALAPEKSSSENNQIRFGRSALPVIMARVLLDRMLRDLTPKQSQVIRLKFGLDDGIPREQVEIAEEMNICQQRVSQLKNVALRRLRHPERSKALRMFLGINNPSEISPKNGLFWRIISS